MSWGLGERRLRFVLHRQFKKWRSSPKAARSCADEPFPLLVPASEIRGERTPRRSGQRRLFGRQYSAGSSSSSLSV